MDRTAALFAAPFVAAGLFILAGWVWSWLAPGEPDPLDPRPRHDDFTM